MKKGQKLTKDGYELIGFPMETMNITQGNNGQFSHKGVNALDIAGKDAGIEPTYAPVSMHLVVTDSYANANAVFMESDKKVMFADGTIDYATFMFLHDNYIADIAQVKKFAQGQEFGDEGTAGYATGNHCHFEVAKGKYSHMYDKNAYGTYHLPGSISADKACVVDGTTIKNGNGMAWKKADQIGSSKPAAKDPYTTTLKWIDEKGTATFTKDSIRIHKDTPDGAVIPNVTYNSGNSVKYIAKCAYKGHRWVKYVRASGGYGVVAVSGSEVHGKDPWATFK
ncbi:hypothetical protein [uncultured Dubosiella sp.]|uniref:hypothetical protein n=1 Tax=uncultured Dubosiella sp. TaxID=1937011 RepID=UPI00272F8EFF|nr:hypothetical protein [uncultured Dubosiella sp.]